MNFNVKRLISKSVDTPTDTNSATEKVKKYQQLCFELQIKTVPTELTIASVKELFLQISLAPTNGPASLDTVNAAEIREL